MASPSRDVIFGLAGNPALALAQNMIDRGSNAGDGARRFARRPQRLETTGKFFGNEGRRQLAFAPARMLHDRGKKRDVVADAFDGEGVKRVSLRDDGLFTRLRMGDELGDHRVVVDRDFAAFGNAGVVAHRHARVLALRRRPIPHQPADRRHEIAVRVLGINPRFDRPAGLFHVTLLEFQLFARSNADHLLDEIDAGDKLGDRVLDLQPRVHFEKKEAAVLRGDEFNRAGAVVADGLRQRDRLLAHLLACRSIEQRRRRFLDHLLIAALDRTFALAEVNDIAVLVAKHLNFDMARIGDEFLDEDAVVTETGFRFRARARISFRNLVAGVRNAHALAATAGGGLDHDGVADLFRDLHRLLVILDDAEVARHGRDLGLGGGLLAFDLVAHRRHRLGIGADEHNPGLLDRRREGRTFRQEAVAGVYGLGAAFLASRDDVLDDEIALGGRRRADGDGLIGYFDVERVAVGVGIDRNGCNPHPACGFYDATGDFAAIGNEDSLEHSADRSTARGCVVTFLSYRGIRNRASEETRPPGGTNDFENLDRRRVRDVRAAGRRR
jgi:hypothetical protein